MIKKFVSTKAFKYQVSGSLAFTADYTILAICVTFLHLPTIAAVGAGLVAGILISFSLNKLWTFKSNHRDKTSKQFALYLVVVGLNSVFTILFIMFLKNKIPVLLLKPLCVAMIAVWNFFINKHIIFKSKQ